MKPTEKIVKRAVTLDIDFKGAKTLNKRQVRKQMTAARQDLWKLQKNATQEQVDWLEKNARNIARAEGELDWKKK